MQKNSNTAKAGRTAGDESYRPQTRDTTIGCPRWSLPSSKFRRIRTRTKTGPSNMAPSFQLSRYFLASPTPPCLLINPINNATPDILRHSSIMAWFVSYQPLRGASHCRSNNRNSGAAGGNPQHPFEPSQAPLARSKPFQKSERSYPCRIPSTPIG